MSASEPKRLSDMKVDVSNLHREEIFTDLSVATIRRLTPVKADGTPDPSREPTFVGQTHVMTSAGVVPIECPIEASSLAEAADKFPQAAEQAMENLVAEVEELRRQQASRIVVPKTPPGNIQLS
jgi:hypothetical protein